MKRRRGREQFALLLRHLALVCAGSILHPQRELSASRRDKSNRFSVGRPARIEVALVFVRGRGSLPLAAIGRDGAQLIASATLGGREVHGIHHALTIGRPIGPYAPCSFLVEN